MSTSPTQLKAFAELVLSHDALLTVRERVQKRLFDRFRRATPAEREVINAIMDNENLFHEELKIVLNEFAAIEAVNDEEVPE